MNRLLKVISLVIIIFFLSLYFSRYTYSKSENVLTEEAIVRFEKDLKEGRKIVPTNYLPKEKNYDNKASITGRKVSNFIEKSFKKILNYSLKYLNGIN